METNRNRRQTDKFIPGCYRGPDKGAQLHMQLMGGLLRGGSARAGSQAEEDPARRR